MMIPFLIFFWNFFRFSPSPPKPSPIHRPTVIKILPPTPTLIPSLKPTPTETPTPSLTPTPSTSSTSDINALLDAVNSFRADNNEPKVQKNPLLCQIAQKRVDELVVKGSLDGHEGIHKYTDQIFLTFSAWWEVIYESSPPQSVHDVVFQGWANSPPHRQSLLAADATHGCGAKSGDFAVFLLGQKKLN